MDKEKIRDAVDCLRSDAEDARASILWDSVMKYTDEILKELENNERT